MSKTSTLRSGLGHSSAASPAQALREAAEAAVKSAGVSRADAALVLFSRAQIDAARAAAADLGGELLAQAAASLGSPEICAGSVEAVFGAPGDAPPTVSVFALAGLEARSVGIHRDVPEEGFEEEIEDQLGRSLDERDLVFLLAEPTRVNLRRLLAGIESDPDPPALVGLGAADPLVGGGHVSVDVAALVLRGARRPRVEVAQGCRAITPPLEVTAAEGHWIYEIDDRPALRSYREAARDPLAADLRRAAQRIVLGLPLAPGAGRLSDLEAANALGDGRFAARSITGFDEVRGALATSEVLRPGARAAWLLRDEARARDTLKNSLAMPSAGAAFYLSCPGRGASLFQHEGLEEGYVEGALARIPWVGLRGTVQMAPLAGSPHLLQYAGVLALLDPKA